MNMIPKFVFAVIEFFIMMGLLALPAKSHGMNRCQKFLRSIAKESSPAKDSSPSTGSKQETRASSAAPPNSLTPTSLHFKPEKIYVQGTASTNHLLFLSSQEFSTAAQNDTLPVNAIVVLDELPLSQDLPLLAGIIVSQELRSEATHAQGLAEKMSLPLVYIPGAFDNSSLRTLAQTHQGFSLQCDSTHCEIQIKDSKLVNPRRQNSVLPLKAQRGDETLFHQFYPLNFSPRETSGDKYFNLMTFKKSFPDLVPEITSLSSGFYESFSDSYGYNGYSLRTLRQKLEIDLEKANAQNDDERIKDLLAQYRHAIWASTPRNPGTNVFDRIKLQLQKHYNKTIAPYALRSNNDVEDLLATGLYRSSFVRTLKVDDLEPGLKNIWASLYEFRAYAIRRYWGQKEENLSMPIMVHPFVDHIFAHGVGNFFLNNQGQLRLQVAMTLGNEEKATNPSAKAKTLQVALERSPKGFLKIKGMHAEDEDLLTRGMKKALAGFFKQVYDHATADFTERVYRPTSISLEFTLQSGRFFWSTPKLTVLQYKPNLNQETILSVLAGTTTRADTDKRLNQIKTKEDTQKVLKDIEVASLTDLTPEIFKAHGMKSGDTSKLFSRYALLVEDQTPTLVTWDNPRYHADVKHLLRRSKSEWLKSGYIRIRKENGKDTVVFTETTYADAVDRSLLLDISGRFFERAFLNVIKENSELRDLLNRFEPNIEFHTYEGDWTISPTYPLR